MIIDQQNYKLSFRWVFKSTVFTLLIVFLLPGHAFAQRKGDNKEQTDKEIAQNAEIALQEGKFEKALLLFRKLLEKDEKNPLLNFLVGYCYQNTDFGLEQSLSYLKNALEYESSNPENQAPFETNYYLGKAYHANYKFNEAINVLNDILKKTPKKEIEFIKNLKRLIYDCDNGRMLSQTLPDISIENLLDINSKYSDKNPLVHNQSNSIIFSSRRENKLVSKKFEDGQYDDNIYITSIQNDSWTDPTGLSQSINAIDHETACWISEDGNKMIIQKYDKTGGNLYQAQKGTNGEWGRPEKLNATINDGSDITFGSLSPDEKYLYFTSDRKGGFGGTDIYISENIGNNLWGVPKNLGPGINTPLNEESPILNQSGILFFSSEGHFSIGGFDIFASYTDRTGKWQSPVNLGIPINSISNDFFYWPIADGQSAYISSDREGTKGKSDIFKLSYADSLMNTYAIVAGKFDCPPGFDAHNNIEIWITNEQENKRLKPLKPNISGIYNIILRAGITYSLEFSYQGKAFYYAQINLGKSYSIACADQTLIMNDIVINPQNPVINNFSNREIFDSNPIENQNIANAYNAKYEELNGNQSNSISLANTTKDNKYSIKLKNSTNKLPLNSFYGLNEVKEFQDKNGYFIYYWGEYEYEWEAQIKLKSLKENYPDAEVFVFNKNI